MKIKRKARKSNMQSHYFSTLKFVLIAIKLVRKLLFILKLFNFFPKYQFAERKGE